MANDPRHPNAPRRQDALGNKLPNPEEELVLIEKELNELKVAFEQYLLGIDRRSPLRRKDQLAEKIRKLKTSGVVKNTAHRFKLDQVQSKFGSYDRMWTRSIQEMENGTSRRDQFRLKQKETAPKEAAPAPRAAPAPAASALSDGQVKALYDTLLFARQRTGEPTAGLSFEALAATLKKQVPQLLEKHQCKAIDFKVVIKDGKALLKAVPRK